MILRTEPKVVPQPRRPPGRQRRPRMHDENDQGGHDARADVGDDQAPRAKGADGEPDAGAEVPDGAGDVSRRKAAKLQVSLEQGRRHEPKGREPNRQPKDPDHPRIGRHANPLRQDGWAGKDHDGGCDGHQPEMQREHRAQVGRAGIVLPLDHAGMQTHIRELLDKPGEEGNRYNDAKIAQSKQAVERNISGERYELHAAFAHAQGDHPAHGSIPQARRRLAFGHGIRGRRRHVTSVAGWAGRALARTPR